MNEREKFLLRMAVIYLIANLDDANEAFEYDGPDCHSGMVVSVNGEIENKPEEDELDQVMKLLQ
jgi:hypothetical protein